MEIVQTITNELLKRREIEIKLEYDRNPGYEAAHKAISQHFRVDVNTVVIKHMANSFGSNTFLISAYIYESIYDREHTEPMKKEKKK